MISPKRQGTQFEELFYRACIRQCIGILRIPDGCKRVGPKKLIPLKTPCDFILARLGKTALIDTKTQGSGKTFPTANINMNQVHAMDFMVHNGLVGGYICWFRNIDKIIFFSSAILRDTKEGLHFTDGIDLGRMWDMDITKIWDNVG